MIRELLTRGAAASSGAAIPGIRAVLLLAILFASYGEAVGAAVGLTASYFGVALVATAGLGVSAVFTFSRFAARPLADVEDELGLQLRVSAAAALVLIVVTVIGGLVIPIVVPVDAAIFATYWFGYSASVIVLPFTATLTGVFQSRNRDGENLLLSLSGGLLHLGFTALSAHTGQSALMTVLVAGVGGPVVDVLSLAYRARYLAPDRLLGLRSIGAGIGLFVRRPVDALRHVPGSVSGAVDGLVLMTVFTVAGTVATRASVADGAVIVLVVAVLRTLIIPLKQFGMVGGRLIARRRALGEPDRNGVAVLVGMSAVILAVIAGSLVAARAATTVLDLLPWTVVGMMATQLLIEPITGVAFAANKILTKPSFGLRALAIVSFAGTVPVLIGLDLLHTATATTVWGTVCAGRVVFFLVLLPRVGLFGAPSAPLGDNGRLAPA